MATSRGLPTSHRAPSPLRSLAAKPITRRWLIRLMIFSSALYGSLLLVFWSNEPNFTSHSKPVAVAEQRGLKAFSHRRIDANPVQLIRIATRDHTESEPRIQSIDEAPVATEHIDWQPVATERPDLPVYRNSALPPLSREQATPEEITPSAKLLPSGEEVQRKLRCIGWRSTGSCSPDGAREPENDLPCAELVPNNASGYCEVEDTQSKERFRVMRRACNVLRRKVAFRCSAAPIFANFHVQAQAAVQKALVPSYTLPNVDTTRLKPNDGIVMVVYPKLVPSAYATIRMLRDVLDCLLPIEIWFRPDEMTATPSALDPLHRLARNATAGVISFREMTDPVARRFVAKVYAVYNSFFDRVLFLDADDVPVRDPSFLFTSPEFLETGAVFWPDFWHPTSTMFGIHSQSLLWELLDLPFVDMFEQESGQLVVDRRRHAAPLELVLFYATHQPNLLVHFKLAWGDKDLFRLAWLKLGSSFHMIEAPPAMAGMLVHNVAFCGMTMVQHDVDGAVLFLHRNKHKLTGAKASKGPGGLELWRSGAREEETYPDPVIWTHLLTLRPNWSREHFKVEPFTTSLAFDKRQKCFGRRDLAESPQFDVQEIAKLSFSGVETQLRRFAMEAEETSR